MASRRPKRFATRLLLNFGLLWSIFWLAGAAAGYLTVEKGLKSRLEVLLISDVARVAAFYRQGELGQVAATGGASIVLYDYSGKAVIPEDPPFVLPAEVLTGFDPAENPRLGFFYWLKDTELGSQSLTASRDFPVAEDPSLWSVLELGK